MNSDENINSFADSDLLTLSSVLDGVIEYEEERKLLQKTVKTSIPHHTIYQYLNQPVTNITIKVEKIQRLRSIENSSTTSKKASKTNERCCVKCTTMRTSQWRLLKTTKEYLCK